MPVRIFFRGLVLFRLPGAGAPDPNRLVVELISEPLTRQLPNGALAGQDDHQAEIQIITGEDDQQLVPRPLRYGARIDINIPRSPTPNIDPGHGDGISLAPSFANHVPNIPRLAGSTEPALPGPGAADDSYVRNTITVNRGQLRVKDVVIWDAGGFPLPRRRGDEEFERNDEIGARPSMPALVKFMGVPGEWHAANECVLEADGTDIVDIDSRRQPELDRWYRFVGRRNQRVQEGTTDILIRNYEYQRARPVPWGLDYQWLFARLGYGAMNFFGAADGGTEIRAFEAMGRQYDAVLFGDDVRSLLPDGRGHPFPYVVSDASLLGLRGVPPELGRSTGETATDIDSRPVCVPGFH